MARRMGLGRGLDALLGETAGEVRVDRQDSPLRELPIGNVHPNPEQPRKTFDEGELEELAESIRAKGLLQPIVVRELQGEYQIIAGERRYQASMRAGLKTIPALVREVSDEDVLLLALMENLQRSDLSPLEAARGYKVLVDTNGMTHEDVARTLGKSRSSVSNAMRLLELPDEVQELIESGKLTAGHARAILAVEGDESRVALASKVVREGLSVRQTEILAPLFSGKTERIPPKRVAAPETYGQAAKRLRNALGTKVRVHTVRGKNKVEIEFGDDEDLEKIVARVIGEWDERS